MNCAEKLLEPAQFIHQATIEFRFRRAFAQEDLSQIWNFDIES